MKHENLKDISWCMDQKRYVNRNVPYTVYKEYSNEQVLKSDVTLKLFLLKDLMEVDEIPSKIDFQNSADIILE